MAASRWGYYYKTQGRQFTRSGFGTRDAAADALRIAIAKEKGISAGTHMARTDTLPGDSKGDARTLKEYLAYWLDEHAAPRCAPTTMELYRKLAVYLVQHLGRVRICDLKSAPIQEMVNRLQIHGGAKTKEHPEGRPLS